MPKKYDVVASLGEYQKDGETKRKYANVGLVIEKDGKFYLKMTHPVTVNDAGGVVNFFSLFEPRPQGDRPKNQTRPAAEPASNNFDDDVPF